jgi:hypothetical protein
MLTRGHHFVILNNANAALSGPRDRITVGPHDETTVPPVTGDPGEGPLRRGAPEHQVAGMETWIDVLLWNGADFGRTGRRTPPRVRAEKEAIMGKNVGSADKIVRIVVGIALIAFALFGPADIGWKWVGWIGVIPIATALMGWCPAYSILGLRTCPMEKKSA